MRQRWSTAAAALVLGAPMLAIPSAEAGAAQAGAAPACTGTQWAVEFFAGSELAGAPVLERCDEVVDFDWGAGGPGAGVPVNRFSGRWTRSVDFVAGDYEFAVTGDDGVRVRLDGVVVVDGWRDQGATSYSVTVPVAAGVHLVEVEYYEAFGDASVRASFSAVTSPVECAEPGWAVEFFAGSELAGAPVLERCDEVVDFDWGAGGPGAGVPVNRFSGRWTRSVDFVAGDYEFAVTGDDGVRVRLDGVVVVDGWRDQGATSYSVTVPVAAGVHLVEVEYYEAFGDASVRASFSAVTSPVECAEPGWAVEFFAGSELAGAPVLERCDEVVDFDWGAGGPGAGVPVNRFSGRWTRSVDFVAGDYEFAVTGDDGVRVRLDGVVVVDGWRDQGATSYSVTVPVAAGVHLVEVEYYEAFGDASVEAGFGAVDPRARTGEWDQNPVDMPVRAVHATLLPNGKVLLVAGSGNNQAMFEAGTLKASLWDPVANTFADIPVPEDMFCAGHVHLADGDVMVAGGNKNYPDETRGYGGLASNYAYDVASNSFEQLPPMQGGRWYPTLTMLGNGDINVVGGINDEGNGGNVLVERFASDTRTWVGGVSQRWAFWGLYPALHLMDDGQLFYSGTNTFGNALPGSAMWNLKTDTVQDLPLSNPDLRDQSASVLLPPAQEQRVMVMGGGKSYTGEVATSSTYIHDLAAGTHVEGPSLPTGKMYVNSVILPDRTVLETGGADSNNAAPKHTTSIYDPVANRITPMPGTPSIDRMYHSSALLLPDGRVAVFGSNPDGGTFEMRISLYSPGYLFRGPRPEITVAPAVLEHGHDYDLDITSARGIRDVSLVRPMSVTHQLDPNARLVDLPMTATADGATVNVPANPDLLPPGPYMLVVTDDSGVPSVATWVNVPIPAGAIDPAAYSSSCDTGVPCCCGPGMHTHVGPTPGTRTQAFAVAAPAGPWWLPNQQASAPATSATAAMAGPRSVRPPSVTAATTTTPARTARSACRSYGGRWPSCGSARESASPVNACGWPVTSVATCSSQASTTSSWTRTATAVPARMASHESRMCASGAEWPACAGRGSSADQRYVSGPRSPTDPEGSA